MYSRKQIFFLIIDNVTVDVVKHIACYQPQYKNKIQIDQHDLIRAFYDNIIKYQILLLRKYELYSSMDM